MTTNFYVEPCTRRYGETCTPYLSLQTSHHSCHSLRVHLILQWYAPRFCPRDMQPEQRAANVLQQRNSWAEAEFAGSYETAHVNNGDWSSAATFHKTLPHDILGRVSSRPASSGRTCTAASLRWIGAICKPASSRQDSPPPTPASSVRTVSSETTLLARHEAAVALREMFVPLRSNGRETFQRQEVFKSRLDHRFPHDVHLPGNADIFPILYDVVPIAG